jgi:phosphatidylinositol-3-phosphatase
VGARSPQLEELLRRTRVAHRRPPGAGVPPTSAPPALAASSAGGLRLPPARVCALLVAVFLGFGVLIGHVARSPVNDALASARAPLKVELPVAPRAASRSPSGEASTSASETPAPESQPEATPSPATTNTATAKAPAAAKAPATAKPSNGSGPAGPTETGANGKSGATETAADAPAKKLPPIKHVFVIMLSDEPYASVFGPSSPSPYLSGTLEHDGELLARYDAVAHEELADEVALISGQGPTVETEANCPTYTDISPTGTGENEQVLGNGCVYPASTQTLAGQLTAKGLTWKAYIQGTDETGAQAGACSHPAVGASDPTAVQTNSTGAYATFRNPFVYFQSIVGSPSCANDDVGLEALKGDLANPKSTPSFAYIAPDRCHDGNPTPCNAGAPAGVAQSESLLKQVVPEITSSKAYKESGLLVITVDEAPSSGAFADSSSCCGQPLFPNDPAKTVAGAPRGGGAVGALLLSPYIKGGTTNQETFNHFSLLRTIEDLFGLSHLGYAALPAAKSFEPAMFTAGKVSSKG